MEKVCPVCNGLETPAVRCRHCGGAMVDAGKLEDYRGPYSPYMSIDSLQAFRPDTQCVHLLACRDCGRDERRAWELVAV